ncbi:MAG TPA: STAS domain-containing protein [Gemmataceae bacterium]|nr:STAS domain-containing protein [Gemmataceae bacterium]
MAHLVLSAARPDGVTVARVIAPDRRISGATETGPDERPQRLPEDLLRLSRSALGPVVLDCRLVDMIDSAGVGIVLSLWKGLRVAKHPLALCAPESIRQVFEVARLTRLIPCMTDLADAARLILPAGAEITPEGPATAESWASDPDPHHRLASLPAGTPGRKRRLFAVACGRRLGHLLGNAACRRAMELAEAHAEGRTTDEDLEAAYQAASVAVAQAEYRGQLGASMGAAAASADPNVTQAAWQAAAWAGEINGPEPQLALLADVFGNPFRPPRLDPAWLTPHVRDLAQAIDQESDFDSMPALGDALRAAGCDDAELLAHCAEEAEHVRGCWAIDLILGK